MDREVPRIKVVSKGKFIGTEAHLLQIAASLIRQEKLAALPQPQSQPQPQPQPQRPALTDLHAPPAAPSAHATATLDALAEVREIESRRQRHAREIEGRERERLHARDIESQRQRDANAAQADLLRGQRSEAKAASEAAALLAEASAAKTAAAAADTAAAAVTKRDSEAAMAEAIAKATYADDMAKGLAAVVRSGWEWEENDSSWKPYDAAASAVLDEAWLRNTSVAGAPSFAVLSDRYTVDFTTWKQTRHDTGSQRTVRRLASAFEGDAVARATAAEAESSTAQAAQQQAERTAKVERAARKQAERATKVQKEKVAAAVKAQKEAERKMKAAQAAREQAEQAVKAQRDALPGVATSALEPHTCDCAYYASAVSLVRSLCDDSAHPHIVSELFDWDHDRGSRCFCDACFAARSESACCSRGPPGEEIEYEVPKGWARIALQSGRRGTAGMFGSWHPAYHGTSIEGVGAILATGQLARAGDSVISGPHGTKVLKLGVRPGHIKAPFPRTNEHTGKWEMFDPHQIFVSPSFRYSELPQYARKERIAGQEMQFMVRVHMAPGSFAVGQETVGASRRISPGIPNESLEWYTKGDTKGAILIDSLCVKLL